MTMALIPVAGIATLEAREKADREANNPESADNQAAMTNLAAHLRRRWETAKTGKREIEQRMLMCLRQRRGEYEPHKLAEIRQMGGSEVYIMLTSVKCRAVTSWLRDTLLGTGSDKPWAIDATPEPELPEDIVMSMQAAMAQELMQRMAMGMETPTDEQLQEAAKQMKERAARALREEADKRVDRMELKMEDQLAQGGWMKALDEFLDDIVTFPYAVIKGPVKRKRKVLKWQNNKLQPVEEVVNEWERVDPFMLYWAPWASDIQDGFIIERHKMTEFDLQALIGVPGYNEQAIREVLQSFSGGGLREWLWTDSEQAMAEGKNTTETILTTDLIDALQMWDNISGRDLLQWGMTEKDIPDPDKTYPCEVWLVGNVVIRAVLNFDPLARKPYYVTSYERIPGAVAGKGVPDLCRDSQDMVNAAARSLANNMGISSGPQVGVNMDRMAAGEDVTQMYPWKIWQFTESEVNTTRDPLQFFQPNSNAQELMAVFEKFVARADEDTMIPRYMTGEHTPGVGRTSSGLAMLISNAGKGIKQVITNIDRNIIVPAIERCYQDNLRYNNTDPDIIGDLHIVARGASSLVVKEAEAVRRNELLSLVLNSPLAQQIVGMDGTAELLRGAARNLNDNVDRIVPDREQISTIQQQQQIIQQLQQVVMQLSGQDPMAQGGGGPKGQPSPANPENQTRQINGDGSEQGGRESNFVSARPNGA